MISSIKNFLNAKFTPSDKDFEAHGVLSPQQFMKAGEQLTNFGWKWQHSLDKPSKLLPDPHKQLLMSTGSSPYRILRVLQQQITQQACEGFLEVGGESYIEEREEDFRKYTIFITYDEYYHTPRLWLKGTDVEGRPLTTKQMFEDIYAEYQNETVTEEECALMRCRMLTIHPCKHSEVMKRFVEESKANGKMIKPHQALIVFLKFMSSIMPTIRYDQTNIQI